MGARVLPAPAPAPASPRPRTASTAAAPPAVKLAAAYTAEETRGEPLPVEVRSSLEQTFNTSLADVRVHTGRHAQNVAVTLSARAVTQGTNILLGPGERATNLELIAHEVAHVVQQRGVVPREPQRFTGSGGDHYEHEARQAASAAVQGQPFTVRERTRRPLLQRLGVGDLLDKLAGMAEANIPGYDLFTLVIGINPINMSRKSPTAANILRAGVRIMPGGGLISRALDEYSVFEKVGTWVEQQIRTLGLVGSAIRTALMNYIDGIPKTDIVKPWTWDDHLSRALAILSSPAKRLWDFVVGLAAGILDFLREAVLKPLAALAKSAAPDTYDLLCMVLGSDPITKEDKPFKADTAIPAFLKLIGEQETWERIQKTGAIGKISAWFNSNLAVLLGFVSAIPGLVVSTVKSIVIEDLIPLTNLFVKVGKAFGGFAASFIGWIGTALWNLLEIIFEVVSPGALAYVKKTGAALKRILKDPGPFVGNLVKAAKGGFDAFAGNFGAHLKKGLINWLTGSLQGVYIPAAFSLVEIIKFVLSVLGLTWANIRPKLVKATSETIVKAMEAGFDLVRTLVTKGPAAFWQQLQQNLADLQGQVVSGIISMVVGLIVQKAIPKVIAMFIPGAGFIALIVSIYDIIMTFVNRLKQIAAAVMAFVDSIVAIAAGNIGAAVKRVESVLASLLSLAIAFLFGFAGLGKVADKVMGVITKVRAPIDKALDALIAWVVNMAKKLFAKVFGKKDDKRTDAQKQADLTRALAEAASLQATKDITDQKVRKGLVSIRNKYKMTSLTLVVDSTDAEAKTEGVHVEGEINPKGKSSKGTILSEAQVIKEISIPRPSGFRSKTSKAVNPTNIDLLKQGLDRCHVVSSHDMAKHYEETLTGKTWQEAKTLLQAKSPVKGKLTGKAILNAAKKLHKDFFNDVDNLFLDAADVNRALAEHVDTRHPAIKGNLLKLKAHIELMTQRWGLVGKAIKVTGV